ncbi:MAG: phosphotransferase, partial [Victivallales bacterium]
LCEFQRSSFQGNIGIGKVIENIKACRSRINIADSAVEKNISLLLGKLKRFTNIEVPTSAVHGDFNLENILVCGGRQYLIDFEHYENRGLPFFDFGNITVSSLLMAFGNRIFIGDKYNGVSEALMRHWVSVYQKNSGINYDILKLICPIAAMEQKAKAYPAHRNPDTYPMYPDEIFKKLIDPGQFTL